MDVLKLLEKYKDDPDEITATEFIEALGQQQGDIKVLNEKIQDIIYHSARELSANHQVDGSVVKAMFPALVRGDFDKLHKLGFQRGFFKEDGSDWTMRVPIPGGSQKTLTGSPLYSDAVSGSYLAGESYFNEVLRIAKQASVCMGRVTTLDMEHLSLKVPTLTTDVSLTWVTDQSTAKTETNPVFDLETLTAKTCAAWLSTSDELEDDSIVALGILWTALYSRAWGLEFDKQVLTANAAPFTGILYDADVNDLSMGSGRGTFSDLKMDDFVNLQDAIEGGETAHLGAGFIMHRSILSVVRKLKDDNGNPLWQRGDASTPPTIMGTEYILSDVMPKLTESAASTPFIIYGNLGNWLWGKRAGLEIKKFDSTIKNLEHDQVFWRFKTRGCAAPGIPSAFSRLKTSS